MKRIGFLHRWKDSFAIFLLSSFLIFLSSGCFFDKEDRILSVASSEKISGSVRVFNGLWSQKAISAGFKGARVYAVPAGIPLEKQRSLNGFQNTVTGPEGLFSITGMNKGEYILLIDLNDDGRIDQRVSGIKSDALSSSTPLEVIVGELSGTDSMIRAELLSGPLIKVGETVEIRLEVLNTSSKTEKYAVRITSLEEGVKKVLHEPSTDDFRDFDPGSTSFRSFSINASANWAAPVNRTNVFAEVIDSAFEYAGVSVQLAVDGNSIPAVRNIQVSGISGIVSVSFDLEDDEGDACDLEISYSEDGGRNFRIPAGISGNLSKVSSGPVSLDWNTSSELSGKHEIIIRIVPFCGEIHYPSFESPSFVINNIPGIPGITYISASAAPGGDGSCWARAFRDLQSALAQADPGDEFWITDGSYVPADDSDRTKSFQMVPGLKVYGGFSGTEVSRDQRDWTGHKTVLSGDIGSPGSEYDNSYTVIRAADGMVLDGIRISGGRADGNGDTYTENGGGIHGSGVGITLRNCLFENNFAFLNGGALILDRSTSSMTGCVFQQNVCSGSGGGIRLNGPGNHRIAECVFTGNDGRFGGAISNQDTGSDLLIDKCLFTRNIATEAAALSGLSSSSIVRFSRFVDNLSTTFGTLSTGTGGGIIHDCVFTGNGCSDGSGAITGAVGNSSIVNCTIIRNSGGIRNMYGGVFHISNSIIRDNSGNNIALLYGAGAELNYCNVEGGYPGAGNIDADPLFAGLPGSSGSSGIDAGAVRLQSVSPCIDSGSNSQVPDGVMTDLFGGSRFFDVPGRPDQGKGKSPIVDIGAHEYQ